MIQIYLLFLVQLQSELQNEIPLPILEQATFNIFLIKGSEIMIVIISTMYRRIKRTWMRLA